MNCLIDKVNIAGCGSTASGFIINQLPGINLASIESLADSEQKDYLGVWSDVQIRAARKFAVDVRFHLARRYKIKELKASFDLGKIINTTNVTAAAAEYRGWIADLDFPLVSNDFKNSDLSSHYIQTLNFYSPAVKAGAVFKVWDYNTNTIIDSFTKDLVIGWNTITVNTSYPYSKIVIATDSSTFNSVELLVPKDFDCCGHFRGVKFGLNANVQTLTEGTNCYGLSAIYGIRCKFDNVVCNNVDAFMTAWMYLLASELQIERKYSPRINRWTMKGKECDELKDLFDADYEKTLKLTIDSITLNLADECLECDGMYNIKEMPTR